MTMHFGHFAPSRLQQDGHSALRQANSMLKVELYDALHHMLCCSGFRQRAVELRHLECLTALPPCIAPLNPRSILSFHLSSSKILSLCWRAQHHGDGLGSAAAASGGQSRSGHQTQQGPGIPALRLPRRFRHRSRADLRHCISR